MGRLAASQSAGLLFGPALVRLVSDASPVTPLFALVRAPPSAAAIPVRYVIEQRRNRSKG
ncbi:MAG: hypothetical protein AAFY81_06830, partial [Pseudomonadota bacterium]